MMGNREPDGEEEEEEEQEMEPSHLSRVPPGEADLFETSIFRLETNGGRSAAVPNVGFYRSRRTVRTGRNRSAFACLVTPVFGGFTARGPAAVRNHSQHRDSTGEDANAR